MTSRAESQNGRLGCFTGVYTHIGLGNFLDCFGMTAFP